MKHLVTPNKLNAKYWAPPTEIMYTYMTTITHMLMTLCNTHSNKN